MSYTKLAVPVALGLSLVTVTACVVYYIFKKDEEERKGGSVQASRVNVIEISVSKSIVPALIGRSGSNIKEIERKSGALIHFKKFTEGDHDTCIIRGRSGATQLAEMLVHEFIRSQPDIVEDTLSVPNWSVGRIIGTGGENITYISHRSGARVKVEGGPSGDHAAVRKITFRGTTEQIDMAKGLVQTCISQEKSRREAAETRRTPRHLPSPSPPPPAPPRAPAAVAVTSHDSGDAGEGDMLQPGDATQHAVNKQPEVSGSSIEVYVSAVSSPARFWVQFAGAQVTRLDELVQTMTDYYSRKENREMHALERVSVGQVVAAVFRHDGCWYRARVVDIRPNEFDTTKQVADVFFVDYGDSEYVATHELCELRADLLRLRFQAMECFLAGVHPAGPDSEVVGVTEGGQRWDKWPAPATERFEELTQVARWKALVSKTCSYRNTVTADGEKEREIPGIMLYDVTEEGSIDIGGVLIAEGWAVRSASPRASPARALTPAPPFGDLGKSHILGIVSDRGDRSASLPKDHERADHSPQLPASPQHETTNMPTSKSLASGLEHQQPNLLSYGESSQPRPSHNGSNDSFLQSERQDTGAHSSAVSDSGAHSPAVSNSGARSPAVSNSGALSPGVSNSGAHSPGVSNSGAHSPAVPNVSLLQSERLDTGAHSPSVSNMREELKANMNRIDSHPSLEALAKAQQEAQKGF